jgi:hypothetical protein
LRSKLNDLFDIPKTDHGSWQALTNIGVHDDDDDIDDKMFLFPK